MKTLKYLIPLVALWTLSCTSNKAKTQVKESVVEEVSLEAKPAIGDTVSLPSGLKYKILQEGIGRKPTANSKVRVHYHGTLTNGKVFDSSIKRGTPLTFNLNQVIKGWQEGLQLMKEGAIYELYIPSKLGYGSRGAGSSIPPFADLIFRVELLKVF